MTLDGDTNKTCKMGVGLFYEEIAIK